MNKGPTETKRAKSASAHNLWDNPEARRVLDSMTELFFAVDREYNLLFVNRAVLIRNNRTADEYDGKNHWDLWPTMKGTVVEESYRVAFATGVPIRFEYHYEPTEAWIDANVYPHADQLHIYFRDITDRKMAEGQLAKAERDLRAVLDAIPHVAWALNAEGSIEYINAKWFEFTGLDSTDQQSMRKALHPDDVDRVVKIMERSRSTGTPEGYDVRTRTKDGDYRWLRVRWSPLKENGKIVRWIGTSTDVHDEVLALNALREAGDHQSFRTNSSPQIPWLAGPDGIIYESGAQWTELTGLTDADMPEAQINALHPEDAPGMLAAWTACLQSGEPFDFEHRVKVKDGQYRWMRSRSIARRNEDGSIVRWYGTTEDIHDRRLTELALRDSEEQYRLLAESLERLVHERTAELEAAYREQESFSYSVSHDLRAPLRSIVSSARILEEDFGSNLPGEAKNLLDQQAHAALRLAQLIDDLLELSRIGRGEVVRSDIDLTEVFKNVARVFEAPNLKFRIQDRLKAKGDPRLIQLLAQNLIENSAKFSPDGGTIAVGRTTDGAFFVADEGIGFKSEYASKLFQPFHRLHTDQEFPGTGIGLASVKRIVERHGGRVWAEGKLGQGATFYFTLSE